MFVSTQLHFKALLHIDFEIVDALLQMNGIRVGRSDIYGNTPIDVARQHGHQKIVDVLIAAS